ncbi:MAG: putative sulfate/molybdate transporter [Halovenus sp.]
MASATDIVDLPRLRFGANEVTGAVGDSITVLPLVVALALVTQISLPHVLLVFGAFQILWGLRYGLPISVEPMKALTALAITGVIGYGELVLAGLVLGCLLLAIGLTGTLSRVEKWIGEPVVRGIQFAVALLLLETGLQLVVGDLAIAGSGILIALVVVLLGYKNATALAVFFVGAGITVWTVGLPAPQWPGMPPVPAFTDVGMRRTADGIVAQLAMTIGNAALATSLLVSDLFERDVTPDELSTSMGTMNLAAIPAGGIPMCHGCDGVAGKYEFGARTGGANIVLGLLYIAASLVATTTLLGGFPLAILGVLLVIIALSLGRRLLQSSHLPLSIAIGLLTLVTNLGVAFIIGIIVDQGLEYREG